MRESGEMYLETILVLKKQSDEVHAVDVAEAMHLSRASVSRALARLRAEGCLTVGSEGHLAFTDRGLRIAQKIYSRHQTISRALCALGVDAATAEEDACKIEHDISDATFLALKHYLEETGENAD